MPTIDIDLATALKKFDEPDASPHSTLWFMQHAQIYTEDVSHIVQSDDLPKFFKTYFVIPPVEGEGLTAEARIKAFQENTQMIDVECGPLRIKGTYIVQEDKLDAEVGLQAAPEAYLKLGVLNGNPSKEPITANFTGNPDFYKGDITIRTPTTQELQAAGKRPQIFGGILGNINWLGLGQIVLNRAIDLLAAV